MTQAAAKVLPRTASFSPDREACRAAIEKRFGWLKLILLRAAGGNVSALPLHQQVLWRGREKVVAEFNRIGELPDFARRARAYQKLIRELGR